MQPPPRILGRRRAGAAKGWARIGRRLRRSFASFLGRHRFSRKTAGMLSTRPRAAWVRAALAFSLSASLLASLAACHGAGSYGYSAQYAPASGEEEAVKGGREYDPVMYQREPEEWRGRRPSLFGVVTGRAPGPGGSGLPHAQRAPPRAAQPLLERQRRGHLPRHRERSRLRRGPRDRRRSAPTTTSGEHSVGGGSLVRVVGTVRRGRRPGRRRADHARHLTTATGHATSSSRRPPPTRCGSSAHGSRRSLEPCSRGPPTGARSSSPRWRRRTRTRSSARCAARRSGAPAPRHRAGDDFWSWRGRDVPRCALALDPESIAHRQPRRVSRALRAAGVRTVGEFHYVQHQPDGTPYAERTLLARRGRRGRARAEGLRDRAPPRRLPPRRPGPGRRAGQRRFCDPDVDAVLRDVDALRAKYKDDPDVRRRHRAALGSRRPAGVAPRRSREYAARHGLPFHMHVAEQPREIDECLAETGKRPVELLADLGVALGALRRRPRDPPPPARGALLGAGARLRVHLRHDRARSRRRPARSRRPPRGGRPPLHRHRQPRHHRSDRRAPRARDPRAPPHAVARHLPARAAHPRRAALARRLARGALACGFADAGGHGSDRARHPALDLVEDELLLDAVVFSGSSSWVRGGRARSTRAPTGAAPEDPHLTYACQLVTAFAADLASRACGMS